MAHKCKCVYCKVEFDRDKEPWEQIANLRYAHKKCAEENKVVKSKNELDYEALISYIEKLLGNSYVKVKVVKQIKDFKEQYGYTYSGILGTLIYWYEVKGATLEMANGGIGIVPYIYQQAKEYYAKISEANNINSDVVGYKFKVREITIESPQQEMRQPRLFRLEEENE